jgi:adenylate kinase family enzyme
LFSGPTAVGKTSIARVLIEQHGYRKISTSTYLRHQAEQKGVEPLKATLQEIGDALDVATEFSWVLQQVANPALLAHPLESNWLLDSVRKPEQVALFRSGYPGQVWHVHLTAPEEFLRANYTRRLANDPDHADDTPYDVVVAHSNEISSRALGGIADLIIEVALRKPSDVAALISNRESLA